MSTSCSPKPDLHRLISTICSRPLVRLAETQRRSGGIPLPPWHSLCCSAKLAVIARLRQTRAVDGHLPPGWEKREMNYLLVFIGGGLGSSLRHLINVVSLRAFGTTFPYHTFIINITGSTVMGLIAGYLAF